MSKLIQYRESFIETECGCFFHHHSIQAVTPHKGGARVMVSGAAFRVEDTPDQIFEKCHAVEVSFNEKMKARMVERAKESPEPAAPSIEEQAELFATAVVKATQAVQKALHDGEEQSEEQAEEQAESSERTRDEKGRFVAAEQGEEQADAEG